MSLWTHRAAIVGMTWALGLPAGAAAGPPAAAEGPLAAVEAFLDALSRRDAETMEALLAPDSLLLSLRLEDGEWRSVRRSREETVRSLAEGEAALGERIWSPAVHRDGPVASVWAPYAFRVDGALSHCGHDAFHLVEFEGRWRIASLVYTVRGVAECPPEAQEE